MKSSQTKAMSRVGSNGNPKKKKKKNKGNKKKKSPATANGGTHGGLPHQSNGGGRQSRYNCNSENSKMQQWRMNGGERSLAFAVLMVVAALVLVAVVHKQRDRRYAIAPKAR